MKTVFLIVSSLLLARIGSAQEEDKPSVFSLSGYAELYYAFDFNQPVNNTRPPFVYSFNRHNEVNLNLGYLKGAYYTDRVRANLALMAGTYANANLAAEPGVLKNVREANAGFRLSSSADLWIDAGVFGSHIGFESAVGKDCWTLTRSMLADNTPYYEAGVKVSYTAQDGRWFFSGLMLNGWQRIQRVDGNSLPSFGTQVTFRPSQKITINSSTFIGTDKPDSARLMRYFHNLYGIFQVSERVGITAGFDYGIEQRHPQASGYNSWLSPVMIVRFDLNQKLAVSLRGEYYQDEYGVIIATGTPHGFKTTGVSVNADYKVLPNAWWRVEVKRFKSRDEIFEKGESFSDSNACISTSIAVSF